ncbi:hypothetical protein ACNJYC_12825 [Bradyrhizobium sp. DASA03007]|uniref:hypothetical protein n=1 Tax=Bradyrhizobium sp. SPXBL-03 TaxID=3395913 RepID=UPI003F6F0B6E
MMLTNTDEAAKLLHQYILWEDFHVITTHNCSRNRGLVDEYAVSDFLEETRILTVLHAFSKRVTLMRPSSVADTWLAKLALRRFGRTDWLCLLRVSIEGMVD